MPGHHVPPGQAGMPPQQAVYGQQQVVEVRAGETARNMRFIMAGAFALLALMYIALADWGFVVIWGVLSVLSFAMAFVAPSQGVTLTPQGITVRGWSTHQLAWPEIQAIEPNKFMGADRALIRLVNGKKIRPWAPISQALQRDPTFHQKVATMQQWHAHYARQGPMAY